MIYLLYCKPYVQSHTYTERNRKRERKKIEREREGPRLIGGKGECKIERDGKVDTEIDRVR